MAARRTRRAVPADAGNSVRWVRISALGAVTIVSYGVAYYSFGALIDPITRSTGWSTTALGATFSAVIVIGGAGGLFGGRLVDRFGTRPAFLAAGTFGAGGIAAASLCRGELAFAVLYALGAGAISALGFYHVTQPAAIRAAPGQPQRAVVRLTIFGAFASPIFLPLTAWLVDELGWRGALRIQAVLTATVFLISAPARGAVSAAASPEIAGIPRADRPGQARLAIAAAWHSPLVRRWVLASMISGAAIDVILVYQVPIMVAAGLPAGMAATIGGIRGFAQVGGRLPLSALLARLGTKPTIIVALLAALTGVLLLLASHHLVPAIGYCLLAGISLSALSTLQGIYTNELVGSENLSLLMGAQQAAFAAGSAFGPVMAGAIFQASGSYTPVVLITAAGLLTSALILRGGRSNPTTDRDRNRRELLRAKPGHRII
jgi:MFS family permease